MEDIHDILKKQLEINHYVEKLWFMINKDNKELKESKKILEAELIEQMKLEGSYKNIFNRMKTIEDASKIVHWEYWNDIFDPPKEIKKIKLNLDVLGIYEIVNIRNGKRYIGQSKHIKTRWKQHTIMLNAGYHHCENLQDEWVKFGKESFRFNVVEIITNIDNLSYYERYWWENLDGEKYNNVDRMIKPDHYKMKSMEIQIEYLKNKLTLNNIAF